MRRILHLAVQVVGIGIILIGVMLATTGNVYGQQGGVPLGTQWSFPQRIPGYDNEAFPPYLVADRNRTVHAFNSVNIDRELLIVYSQWTTDTGWTDPIDILLSPIKQQARIKGAFLDEDGMVHVIFYGGDDLSAAYFYSRAPLINAGQAPAWSELRLIGEDAIPPIDAALTGDGKDTLYVVYSGAHDGVGLYAVYSTDGGSTWTEPAVVYQAEDDVHWPSGLRLLLDSQKRLHAVWTMVSNRGTGDAIYHSRLDADRKQWSEPVVLAVRKTGEYEVDWPSIVEYNQELFLIYNDSFPATRWMLRSSDGGITWSDPMLPFNFSGEYGHAAFVIDSSNYLHMILGNRTESQTHGMWHSVWLGDRWSELEGIVTGPKSPQFDPSAPSAVISQGNVILVTWWTDTGGLPRNGVWFSYTTLNTPELPVEPVPTPRPRPTATPRFTVADRSNNPSSGQPAQISLAADAPAPVEIQSPSRGLILALIPAAMLILGVLAVLRLRSNSRR